MCHGAHWPEVPLGAVPQLENIVCVAGGTAGPPRGMDPIFIEKPTALKLAFTLLSVSSCGLGPVDPWHEIQY